MNEQEVLQDLRSKVKPYLHVNMSQSYFSNTITRHEAGLLKPRTLIRFLEKFGYKKDNGIWQKI